MLKKPDKTIILLAIIFLIGLAMIIIPIIRQSQEIEEDNSIYSELAEQMCLGKNCLSESVSESTTEAHSETPKGNHDSVDLKAPTHDIQIAEGNSHESTVKSDLPGIIIGEVSAPETRQPVDKPVTTEYPAGHAVVTTSPKTDPTSVPATHVPDVTVIPAPNVAQETRKPQETKVPDTTAEPVSSQNADYVAWLSIPGTVINYPVVRSDRTEYYLHHLFNGQKSKLGCLFSLTTSDYKTPSRNIAIYGHHLSNSNAMFSTLMNYKKESYWKSHQTIILDTIYGKRSYQIFSVLNCKVSEWDASTASFPSDTAFINFVNRARQKAFYDTGVQVSESDHILTLITCDRSFGGVQGRLLVMGVEK